MADLFGFDLFGNPIVQAATGAVAERFTFPPFTVLDAASPAWVDRRRAWEISIGAEVGSPRVACDPVLAEVSYKWFSPADAVVIGDVDCVAATAVAAGTGRRYVLAGGVDNQAGGLADFAMLMPFANEFTDARVAATQSVAQIVGKMRNDTFACCVCPSVRLADGRQVDTLGAATDAFIAAGWRHYNEVALLAPPGLFTAERGQFDERVIEFNARKVFNEHRLLLRKHTLVAYFVLGDSKRAARVCDTSGIGIGE